MKRTTLKNIKQAVVSLVLAIILCMGIVAYASYERPDVEIEYNNLPELHEVICDGAMYWIPIPNEVQDLDGYAHGFCESVRI